MSDEKISKAAYFYLSTSANNGFALSQNELGRIHFEKAQLLGEKDKNATNISASIMWLSRAKSQGDSCSSALLDQLWLYLGLSDAFIICAGINDGSQMKKCVAGSRAACIQEGVDLVKSGYHKASGAYLFFQSCKNNSALGCMYLSKMYGNGVGLPKSKEFSEMYKNYAMKIDKNITSFPLRDF